MTAGRARSWPVGFRIRPSVDLSSSDVEVADSVTGRRFRWSPESLSDYILRDHGPNVTLRGDQDKWAELFEAAGDRGPLLRGWRHWQDRGWYPSDQYYVASRRWEYVDTVDTDKSIRSSAVERFLAEDGPPVDEECPEGPTVALGPPILPPPQKVSRLLVTRRSGRAYVPKPASLGHLSGLLWYGLDDVRKRRERTTSTEPLSYLDSYGSAWDFHLCVYNVDGVPPGAYRYDILAHELIGVRPVITVSA